MKKSLIGFIATAVLMGVSSCSTPKNVTYFPELNTGTIITAENFNDIIVKPEDKLSIVVSTQDPALSSLFNLVTTQNNLRSNSMEAGEIGAVSNSGGEQVSYYTVDPQGEINSR